MTTFTQVGPDWRTPEFRQQSQALRFEQKKRVDKLRTDQFYLMNAEVMASHNALFYYDISGSTQTKYTVLLKSDGRFTCACPDHRNGCRKHNVVCKHVVFLLFRVLKLVSFEFFTDNALHPAFAEEVYNRSNILVGFRQAEIQNLRRDLTTEIAESESLTLHLTSTPAPKYDFSAKRVSEEDCAICFDTLAVGDVSGCPTCNNSVHKNCISRWLQLSTKKTCVYCRSPVWKYYK